MHGPPFNAYFSKQIKNYFLTHGGVCLLGKYYSYKLLLFNIISLIKRPLHLPLYSFSIHNQLLYLLNPLLTKLIDNYI